MNGLSGRRGRRWMANSAKIAGTAGAVALCGILAMSLEAEEGTASSGVQACTDAWNDAPAASYCTQTSISRAVSGSGWGNCIIEVSSCSITVDVDDASTTFTPSWPSDYTSTGDGVGVNSAAVIDICFASSSSASSGFTATVKTGCASTETGSASATSSGLSS